jgi:hypothetical protein
MTREYTTKLLDMVDNEALSAIKVLEACLYYMSEDQVKDMMRDNDFLLEEEEDEDDAALNDFNYVGSRHHY